jgi:hypothetical protein
VIFGGGGHADNPYAWASLQPFRSEIFSRNIVPDTLDMPAPTDLELTTKNLAWMRRLSVAYGLSFERSQLTPFIYPSNVGEPKPEDLWQPYRRRGHAPTKDEV